MSAHLKKPWKALPSLPFDQLFFTEGKDDEFYLTGKLNANVEDFKNTTATTSTNRECFDAID